MGEEWISWDTASELTGIKVPTIEHAVRVGRIERRPRSGNHPSLRRESVMIWAVWWHEMDQRRLAVREGRDPRIRRPAPPGPPGWLSTQEAGRLLGRTPRTILRWVAEGELVGKGSGRSGRLWIEPESVEAARQRHSRWVSWVEAARILGCSQSQIRTLLANGEINQRRGEHRATPSLERASIEAHGQRHAEHEVEPN